MKVVQNAGKKRQTLKDSVLAAVNTLIDEHPLEYHPFLYNMLLREVDILAANYQATNIPIIDAVVEETAMTKAQVGQYIIDMDLENRTRLSTAIREQIRSLKELGL